MESTSQPAGRLYRGELRWIMMVMRMVDVVKMMVTEGSLGFQHQEVHQTEHQLINAPTGGGAGLQPRESRPGGCDLILPKTKKLKCIYVVKQI